MDISLLVFAIDDINEPCELGDIVSVDLKHSESCTNKKCVLVHVLNIPDKAPKAIQIRRIRTMLTNRVVTATFNDVVRYRAFKILTNNAPVSIRTGLKNNREATIDWSVAKQFLGKKVIVDETNRKLDTLTLITNGDI